MSEFHPFHTRFVSEIESLFVQVLGIARQMKLLKAGHGRRGRN